MCDCKKPIFVEAAGPYGRYGRMDEAGLFEALADVAPKARFKAHTEGFTTGQSDDFVGELKNGKLYMEYSFLPDEYKIDEEDFKAKIVIATERFDLLCYEDYCNK